jgi:hypothetical protein
MRNEFEPTYPMEREEGPGKRVRPSLHRRVLYGIIACTLVAWAAIGLLTGHMYLLATGPGGGLAAVPFRGAAAWLFSAGILAIASKPLLEAMDYFGCCDSEQAQHWATLGICIMAGALLSAAAVAKYALPDQYVSGYALASPAWLIEVARSNWILTWVPRHFLVLASGTAGASLCFMGFFLMNLFYPPTPGNGGSHKERAVLLATCGVAAAAGLILFGLFAFSNGGSPAMPPGKQLAGISLVYSMMVACAGGASLLIWGACTALFAKPDPRRGRGGPAVRN